MAGVENFKQYLQLEKIEGLDVENIEKEFFYLLMFLLTVSCQLNFKNDKKLLDLILDEFHKHVTERRFNLPLEIKAAHEEESKLRNRYGQYYKSLKTKENNMDVGFLIEQLPYDFFANLLGVEVDYFFNDKSFKNKFGMPVVKLQQWTGNMLNSLTELFGSLKEKYL